MFIFFTGIFLLASILCLFWLKDRLRKPLLARLAYSEPVARLAVVGAALTVVGALLMAAKIFAG